MDYNYQMKNPPPPQKEEKINNYGRYNAVLMQCAALEDGRVFRNALPEDRYVGVSSTAEPWGPRLGWDYVLTYHNSVLEDLKKKASLSPRQRN